MKTLTSKYGHQVQVLHQISTTMDHLHVVELRARCGNTLEIRKWTVGTVDGKRPDPPSKEWLQGKLDEERQKVADEASWKERVRENIDGIE